MTFVLIFLNEKLQLFMLKLQNFLYFPKKFFTLLSFHLLIFMKPSLPKFWSESLLNNNDSIPIR